MSSVAGRFRRQVQFDLLIFRRNPASTFFTVILPLIFLVIFTSIFGNETLANGAKVATLYVPGILALAIISATTVNLAITMTARRERGILKRVRGTPMPPWVFVGSQAVAGFVLSVLMTVLITVVGRLLFGVTLNGSGIPSLIITVLVGAMSFAVMGLALTAIIPSEEAAPAVTNALMLRSTSSVTCSSPAIRSRTGFSRWPTCSPSSTSAWPCRRASTRSPKSLRGRGSTGW